MNVVDVLIWSAARWPSRSSITPARGRAAVPVIIGVSLLSIFSVAALAQTAAPRFTVVGTVQDQTSAMLPGAEVTLSAVPAAEPRLTQTGEAGDFRFDNVPAGTYDLQAQFPGFAPTISRVRVGPRAPGRQKLVLRIAGLSQEVTVGTQSATLALGKAKENGAKITVDLDAFNVLNTVNLNNYVGNMSSPFFGRATSAQAPRRLQLSMRFEF
jgi:hypothetical protein